MPSQPTKTQFHIKRWLGCDYQSGYFGVHGVFVRSWANFPDIIDNEIAPADPCGGRGRGFELFGGRL